jgi:D-methionine transport system ATP-binding protein
MHLSVQHLSKHFSHKGGLGFTLQPVSFDVLNSQILGIIGRSGSGKTTLLRCLNGLERIDSGDILYNGHSLLKASKNALRTIRAKIGLISQGYNLLSHKTVYENVALPITIGGNADAAKNHQAVIEALQCVGLHNYSGRYPAQLSGGQRQRVAIARALVTEPHILLCDEITSALDPETTAEILALLQTIHKEKNVGILMVTHDMSVIKAICTDVLVMDGGHCVEQGKSEDILIEPQHPTTKALVSHLWQQSVPAVISEKLSPIPLVEPHDVVMQFTFLKESSTRPVIADLMLHYRTPLNILAGSLDHIGNHTFGHLFVSMLHEPQHLKDILQFLSAQYVDVSILGYMQWNTSPYSQTH